jgi:hypothetical protein
VSERRQREDLRIKEVLLGSGAEKRQAGCRIYFRGALPAGIGWRFDECADLAINRRHRNRVGNIGGIMRAISRRGFLQAAGSTGAAAS